MIEARGRTLFILGLVTMSACTHQGGPELPPGPKGGLDQKGNALFIALGKQGAVAVVDVDSWKVAGTVKLSDKYYPHHLGLSPDRTRVAVAAPSADLSGGHGGHGGQGGGALYLLDSRTGHVVAQATPGGTAHNLSYLPDGSAVVFALVEHGMLHLADPGTLAITGNVAVGEEPLEATVVPGTRLVLVASSKAGTLSVVDTETKQVARTLTVGQNPIGAWLGSDGKAYVTSESDRKLSTVDLSGMVVTKTVELPGTPGQTVTTTDGKQLWVALEDRGKVLILSTTDLTVLGEIFVGQRPHGLAADPSGTTIYLTDESAGRLHALDVAQRKLDKSLDLGGAPNGILYRPAL